MADSVIDILLRLNDQFSTGIDSAVGKLRGFESGVSKITSGFTPLSIAAGGALAASGKFAAEWQKSLDTTARGLDITGKELKDFGVEAEGLAKKLNYQQSSAEILRLATSVGKLGIAKNDVLAYTESLVKMGVATDQLKNVEEMATNVAKIGTVFGFTSKDVGVFGAAVNKLDDTTAATSVQILNFTNRMAAIGKNSKLSAQEVAAWGATLVSAGKQPESAARFMSMFIGALGAGTNLTEKSQTAIEKLGFSVKDLSVAFDKDANGTMIKFIDRVKQLDTVSQREILGRIFGREWVDEAMLLVNQTDNLAKNLKAAGDTAGNLAKVNREFDQLSKSSLEGQMNTFKNQMFELGKALGLAVLPPLLQLNQAALPLIQNVAVLIQKNPGLASVIATLLGITAVIAPIGMVVSGIAGLVTSIGAASVAIGGFTTFLTAGFIPGMLSLSSFILPAIGTAATAAFGAFITAAAAISPVIVAVTVFSALAAAVVLNWKPLKAFFADLFTSWGTSLNKFDASAKVALTNLDRSYFTALQNMRTSLNAWDASAQTSLRNMDAAYGRMLNNLKTNAASAISQAKAVVSEFMAWLSTSVSTIASNAYNSGASFVSGFANGVKSNIANATSAVSNMTSQIGQYLPHSDAQKGALSQLTASGIAFGRTLMQGIQASGIGSYLGGYLQPVSGGGIRPSFATGTPASGGGGAVTITFNVTGSASDADAIVKALRQRERQLLDLISQASQRINRNSY